MMLKGERATSAAQEGASQGQKVTPRGARGKKDEEKGEERVRTPKRTEGEERQQRIKEAAAARRGQEGAKAKPLFPQVVVDQEEV